MRVQTTRLLSSVIATTLCGSVAFAQDVQNFKPAVGTWNLLSVETASTAKAGLFVPSLYVNYGSNPLVRRDANDEITAKIVENLVGINVMGVIGLHDRFELGVDIPLGYADGEQLTAVLGGSEGFGLGDIRAIPKVRLLGGTRSDVLGLALSIPVSFATAAQASRFARIWSTLSSSDMPSISASDATMPMSMVLSSS